jgi:hypothetical protein
MRAVGLCLQKRLPRREPPKRPLPLQTDQTDHTLYFAFSCISLSTEAEERENRQWDIPSAAAFSPLPCLPTGSLGQTPGGQKTILP